MVLDAIETASRTITIECPIGPLRLTATETALTECAFASDSSADGASDAASDSAILTQTVRELSEYFAGARREFTVPLAFAGGGAFSQSAWRALCEIPYGQTRSYAQQAIAVGNPAAVRAVGSANGRNPIAVIVPCHRVIGSNGSLTGFGGGLPRKKWLLEHEQTVLGQRGVLFG